MKKNIVAVVLALAVITLSCVCAKLYHDRYYLQSEIDGRFRYSYSELILNLWNMTKLSYEGDYLDRLNTENTKHGALLTTLQPYTSYRDNHYLDEIVAYLDQASGADALMSVAVDDELYRKLMELSGDFYSTELAEEIYNMLSAAVGRSDMREPTA